MRGILLAGGQSQRMGQPKQWMAFQGTSLLVRTADELARACHEVIVIANEYQDRERVLEVGLKSLPDCFTGQGPLAGLHAGLHGLGAAELAAVVSCDLPFFRYEVVRDLAEMMRADEQLDAAVPWEQGQLHPLCAVYRGRVAKRAEERLRAGQNAMRGLLRELQVMEVDANRWRAYQPSPLHNMNTPADYAVARAIWQERKDDQR